MKIIIPIITLVIIALIIILFIISVILKVNNISFTKYPNKTISDNNLLNSKYNNYDNELPWDDDVVQCEVLLDIDQDLYKNVLDSQSITFY